MLVELRLIPCLCSDKKVHSVWKHHFRGYLLQSKGLKNLYSKCKSLGLFLSKWKITKFMFVGPHDLIRQNQDLVKNAKMPSSAWIQLLFLS